MAGSPYVIEYRGAFSFPCPPDEVWSAMQRFDRFECWWGWLREFRVEGPGLEAGSVLHGVVVLPLPYRLGVRIAVLECVQPLRIEAAIHGDLEGAARLVLEPEREGTRASVSSTIEVMQRPYIRTAVLKGMPFRDVLLRHAVRNAMINPITVIMLQINYLVAGVVVVETVFAYPGFGRMMLEAALFKDIALIEAGALVAVFVAVATNILGDLAYMILDPRIRA